MLTNVFKNLIHLKLDENANIKKIVAGEFLNYFLKINSSIYLACPFLEGTLDGLEINKEISLQTMLINENETEYKVDLTLLKNIKGFEILIINRTNVYKTVEQLNQSRNDIYFMKREIEEKNKELNRLKKIAEKANEDKSRFLAMVSHEIRNPLNVILGYADLIQNENINSKINEFAKIVSISGKNLKAIANDVLDLSRIEAGKLILVNEPFSIKEIVQQSVNNYQFQIQNQSIIITQNIDNQIPTIILGDKVRLMQILSNLLSNAIKFTNNGEIKINVQLVSKSKEQTFVLFEVADSGRGMNDEQIAKLFVEYEQAEVNDNRVFGGAGLGLSIVKRLVDAMNGLISVQSEVGVGTTFSLEIPFLNQKKRYKRPKKNNVNVALKIKQYKILVADDDVLNQNIIQHMLKSEPYQLVFVNNGEEALQKLKHDFFDLVLLDIHMPILNGDQLIKERSVFKLENQKTPIIALTGNASADDVLFYKKLGFINVIAKPYSHQQLKNTILKSFV